LRQPPAMAATTLNRGAARIVGEDDLDGRPVWVVEVERGAGGDAPLDLEVVAELDRSGRRDPHPRRTTLSRKETMRFLRALRAR
jgi:hypothetical protein